MTEFATTENVVNLFLYGTYDTPSNLTKRLRDGPSSGTLQINVGVTEYMESIGRFAWAADTEIVQNFFNGTLSSSLGTMGSDGVIRLTVAEYLSVTGGNKDPINIQLNNYITGTGDSDYGPRAFIWHYGDSALN